MNSDWTLHIKHSLPSSRSLEVPHVEKEEHHSSEEGKPHPPANVGLLCHDEHPVHGAAESETGLVE